MERRSLSSSERPRIIFPLNRRARFADQLDETDWLLTLVLLIVLGYITDKAGYKREFSLTDTSIQHTFAEKERISFGADIGLCAGVPAAIIIVVGLVWRRSFWDVHNGILGLSS